MKQIKGVVELHCDSIEIITHNNLECAIIKGASTYDLYSYLIEQDFEFKKDLIKELCDNLTQEEIAIIIGTLT